MINLLVVVQSKHSVVVAKIKLRGNKMSFNIFLNEILLNLTSHTLILSPVRLVEGSVRLED